MTDQAQGFRVEQYKAGIQSVAANSPDDYEGGCPKCGNMEVANVGRNHYGFCRDHKAAWCIGSNLYDSWRHEDEKIWDANKRLLADYEMVEPVHLVPENKTEEFRRNPVLKSKGECFAHYAEREPTGFFQLDGFLDSDDFMGRDEDGDALSAGGTTELMSGVADVRVLVRTDDHAQAVRLLEKLLAWFKLNPDLLSDYMPRPRAQSGANGSDIPF